MAFSYWHSRIGLTMAAAIVLGATGAAAATLHRFSVAQSTGSGSGGATTFLQSTAGSSALQGEVATSANASINIPFGVLGEYNTGSAFGIGVGGISTTGYGVGAESLSTAPAMLALNSSNGDGLDAYSDNGPEGVAAIYAAGSGNSFALDATSANASAIVANNSSGFATIYATNNTTSTGMALDAEANGGFGIYGYSASNSGVVAESGAPATAQAPALLLRADKHESDLMDGVVTADSSENMTAHYVSARLMGFTESSTVPNADIGAGSDFQLNGNVYLGGELYTNCQNTPNEFNPTSDCTGAFSTNARARNGDAYRTFTPQQASQTLEDDGEAHLVSGVAHVALDPAFAATISTQSPYLVFTTPQGASGSLYVTNRTPAGFDVRENGTGRSAIAFDYRIVAHPYGEAPRRMARLSPRSKLGYPAPAALEAQLRREDQRRSHTQREIQRVPHALVDRTAPHAH